MSRYVDVEPSKVDEVIETELGMYDTVELKEMLKYFPTADVAPVIHAHWVLKAKISENCFRYNCSHCNRWVQAGAKENPAERFPYCHCGARMDEEVEQ